MPAQTRIRFLAAAIAALLASPQAQAQTAANGRPAGDDVSTLDGVIVLGTTRADVTALTSLAPVDVIGSEAIERTGALNLNQALQRLLPSFNFPQGQNASKGATGIRSASLRGLSPAYTLVLVNGKRRHSAARLAGVDPWGADQFVDINAIPLAAIERVEVLRDGASAQYGSDAVAGVVNIVLRQESSGGSIEGRVGQYDKGDGFSRSLGGWWGTRLPGDGFLNLSADAFSSQPVDRSGVDQPGSPNRSVLGDARQGRWGQGARDHYALLANGETGLGPSLRGYFTANLAYNRTANAVNPNYPSSKDNIRAIYPDGFQPVTQETLRDESLVAGLRWGERASGLWDLSASHGRNRVRGYLDDSLSPSYGLASQTSFYRGQAESTLQTANLDYVRGVAEGRWQLSAGVAARREEWRNVEAGDEQSWNNGGQPVPAGQQGAGGSARWGAVDIAGINPDDLGGTSRKVYGAYAGIEGEITQKLQLGATVRGEHYSDFGSTFNGKLSLRYAFTPAFALRATGSSGYRAPSVAQLGFQSSGYTGTWSFDGTSYLPGRTRQFRPGDSAVAALGARDLDPVKARNLSLGAVYTPDDAFSLTIDAYRISLRGNVLLTRALNGAYVQSVLTAAGLPNFTSASFFANAYDSRTTGMDLVGRYRLALKADSSLDLSLGASAFHTTVSNVYNNNVLPGTGLALFSRSQLLDPENGTPDNKLVLGAHYRNGRLDLDASAVRYGSYTYNNPTFAERDQDYDPQWVAALDLGWAATPQLRFNLGVQNLFDSYPEQYQLLNQTNGINRYGFIQPDGASGRFLYAGFSYAL